MTVKYSINELRDIASNLEKHPEDGRILYASDEFRSQAMGIVTHGFANAVIFPHSNPQDIEERTRLLLNDIFNFESFIGDRELRMRGGELYFDNDEKLSQEDLRFIPPIMSETFSNLAHFLNHDDTIELLPLLRSIGHKGMSPTPMFHYDPGGTVHASGYNPVEFLIGELTEEQNELIRHFSSDFNYFVRAGGELENRIRTANVGDIIVFNNKFPHRSPSTSKEQGQVNFLAEFSLQTPEN